MQTDSEAWSKCHPDDRWIFNKLELSMRLGYICGPAGVDVPRPGRYCIRPIYNLNGMSEGAAVVYLEKSTDAVPAGYFWCEQFEGDHVTVDFDSDGNSICVVQGIRNVKDEIWRWEAWRRLDREHAAPEILNQLKGEYPVVNIEQIGDKVIEIHLRSNPDFQHGNEVAIPQWKDRDTFVMPAYRWIRDTDGNARREGLWVR